jgi:hypothetical protein
MNDEIVDFGKKKQDVIDEHANDEIVDFGASAPQTINDEIVDFGQVVVQPQPTFSLTDVDWKKLETWKYTPTIPLSQKATTDIEDKTKATLAVSALTGVDPEIVQFGLAPIGEELYGEKIAPPNLFKRIANSWTYADLMRQKNKLGTRMAFGDDTPETKQNVAEITAKLPKPEEVLKTIPNAVLSFVHQTFTAGKIIAVGESTGGAIDQLKEAVKTNALATIALMINMPAGVVAKVGPAIKDYTEQTIGNYYLTQIEAGVDPTIARVSTGALTAVDLALNSIPMLTALGAGAKVAKEVGGKVVIASLLKGVPATVAKQLAIQGAYGYGQAVIHTIVPEIAKTLSEKVTGGECSFKDAKQILT